MLDTAQIEARLVDMEKDLSQCFFCRGNGNGCPECTDYRGDAADLRATLDEIARLRAIVEEAYNEGQRDYGANCVREKDVMPIVRSWRNSAARKRLEGGGA